MNQIDNFDSRLQNINCQPQLLAKYQKHLLFEEISDNFAYLLILHRNDFISSQLFEERIHHLAEQLDQLENFFERLELPNENTIEGLKVQLKTYFGEEVLPPEISECLEMAEEKHKQMREEKFYPKNIENFFRPLDILIEWIRDELEYLRREKESRSPPLVVKENIRHTLESETIDITKFEESYKTLRECLDQTRIKFDIPLPYNDLPDNLSEKKIDMREVPVSENVAFTSEELMVLQQYR